MILPYKLRFCFCRNYGYTVFPAVHGCIFMGKEQVCDLLLKQWLMDL